MKTRQSIMRIEKIRKEHYKQKNQAFREDFYARPGRKCRLSELCAKDLKVGKFSIASWFNEKWDNHADSSDEEQSITFATWTKSLSTIRRNFNSHDDLYNFFPNDIVCLNAIFDPILDDWVSGGWTSFSEGEKRKREYKRDFPPVKSWPRVEYGTKYPMKRSSTQFISGPIDENHNFNFPSHIKHTCTRSDCCL